MEILNYIFFGVIGIYAFFIGRLAFGFKKVASFENLDFPPKTKFSIVVPFRNEAKNLPDILYSFSQLNYPRDFFEIIFVNDSSDDNSVEIIENFPVLSFSYQIIENDRKSNSPKKDAISTAIKFSKQDWILTTDADCFVSPDWLKILDNYIQNYNPEMIVGAVSYLANDTFLQQFQQIDLMSLQGATIGSFGIQKPFMCNGANFAYTKKLFQEINGFEENNEIASGDDVFLLQKANAKHPEKVHYLKSDSNIVLTKPLEDFKSLFFQRVRWASKTASYKSSYGKTLAVIVFIGNLAIAVNFFLTIFSLFSFWNWYLLVAIKIFIDFTILYQTGKFLKPKSVKFFLISNLFYPFFSVSVAVFSMFGKYEWKGRRF